MMQVISSSRYSTRNVYMKNGIFGDDLYEKRSLTPLFLRNDNSCLDKKYHIIK